MDYKGKIVRWNTERGFGFIQCEQLDKDVFVHISTLKLTASNPVIGDSIIFKLTVENDGKYKADQAYIEGAKVVVSKSTATKGRKIKMAKGGNKTMPRILQAIAVGFTLLIIFDRTNSDSQQQFLPPAPAPVSVPALSTIEEDFSCDGRTHCSQMTSCVEATYFIKNCPNTKMDGDRDGIPCEKQWC